MLITALSQDPGSKRLVGYRLTEETIRRVKLEALDRRCWPNAIVEAALRRYLDRDGLASRTRVAASRIDSRIAAEDSEKQHRSH